MDQVTVFVGGSTGSDPYAPNTWSGITSFLLAALERHGMLDKAIGLKLPPITRTFFLLKNLARSRSVWRSQFYLDPHYRRALTRVAGQSSLKTQSCLQIGAMFSLPDVFPAKNCISYHDGNLAQLVASGYGLKGVSRKRIDQALRYEEQCAQDMSAVFTFSEYLRQSFIHDYHVSPDKVFNVGAGVNLTELPAFDPKKQYDAKRILFIGVDFIRKGGPELLQAFSLIRERHPEATLHVVGPRHLDSIPQGVTFYGHLSKADRVQKQTLENLFRSSTLFVMPSHYEPFGIAPLEAMLYALPCLVTDGWALREQVRPDFNGALVERGSVADLAAKLDLLLADPARLAEMGRMGYSLATAQYTWDAVVERMRPHFRL